MEKLYKHIHFALLMFSLLRFSTWSLQFNGIKVDLGSQFVKFLVHSELQDRTADQKGLVGEKRLTISPPANRG